MDDDNELIIPCIKHEVTKEHAFECMNIAGLERLGYTRC